ncbi:MAG TPA: vanadium-dependent haloperoxidase [Solirubrobacteraceae bacterium]|nr:vanadium-dependent haloperoxidase [Solirubrobacteraceae bacterium]
MTLTGWRIRDQANCLPRDGRRPRRELQIASGRRVDKGIASKYAYHRWRPITAITATDQGNPNTTTDPTWVPLANTANDPSYPGAHAEFSQAAATVLENFFGTDAFTFSLSNPSVNITRTFTSFSQATNEASESRIFAGQHFQYDQNAGQAQGSRVAASVLGNAFQRLGHHGRDRSDR